MTSFVLVSGVVLYGLSNRADLLAVDFKVILGSLWLLMCLRQITLQILDVILRRNNVGHHVVWSGELWPIETIDVYWNLLWLF